MYSFIRNARKTHSQRALELGRMAKGLESLLSQGHACGAALAWGIVLKGLSAAVERCTSASALHQQNSFHITLDKNNA